MKKAFITGANKGIGLETARHLLREGFYVYLGSRDVSKGNQAVTKLIGENLVNVEMIEIDVTDDNSVKHARLQIGMKTDRLDVLINNAGINGGMPYTALQASTRQFIETFNTNLFGVVRVTQAFIDLLHKSTEPRIVNVSTSVGSITLQSNPDWPGYNYAKYAVYGSSKAALNMFTVNLAYELRNTSFKVNAVCPGYTKTDLTENQGGEVEIAARRIVKYAVLDKNGSTGRFISEETNPVTGEIPW